MIAERNPDELVLATAQAEAGERVAMTKRPAESSWAAARQSVAPGVSRVSIPTAAQPDQQFGWHSEAFDR